MRQEINPPIENQAYPDRLGGNHSSVMYSADERRKIIAGIAEDCYRAMGYRIQPDEYAATVRVWCEEFDCVPDTRLEEVRVRGRAKHARTPAEYVSVYEIELRQSLKLEATQKLLQSYADHRAKAAQQGEENEGKAYAMKLWRDAGILKDEDLKDAA